jgi:spermidine synthase
VASRQARVIVSERVGSGTAEFRRDRDRPGGWTLLVDGYPQSHVDLDDPTYLEFEYVRLLAAVVDLAAPAGVPVRALHLGGGALTLPRYVAATRPGSAQRVVEVDAALVDLVRSRLPLRRGTGIRVRTGCARTAVETTAPGRFELVVTDVYAGARIPARFTTTEFVSAVARVLGAGGVYAANLADSHPLSFVRGQVATLRQAFGDVCLLAEPGVLRGRRFGNVVAVAAAEPGRLPVAQLTRAAARDPMPARLVHGDDLTRLVAGARPVSDAQAGDSPVPPPGLFAR